MPRVSTEAANDSEVDLYAVPPEEFVAARDAAVARARAAGDKERAAKLKALKRPTPSAWLVNALVRNAKAEMDAVFHAGDALIAAQGRVLGGADPSELQTGMRAVREAIGRAMKSARALLADNDRKPTADLERRVTATLRSASLDRRVRDLIRAGALTTDPTVDEVDALADVQVPKHVVTTKAQKHEEKPKRDLAKERREAAEREAREREARERLRAEVEAAAKEEAEARRALSHAEAEERRARAALDEAERAVQEARKAAETAHERHLRAKKRAQ